MFDDGLLLEPKKIYPQLIKEHEQNAAQFLDELTKKSGVDIEENAVTVKKHDKKAAEKNVQDKSLKKIKTKFGWLRALFIIMIIFGIGLFVKGFKSSIILMIVGPILLILGIIFIILVKKSLKPQIEILQNNINKLAKEIKDLENEGYNQLRKLNRLFDYGMAAELFQKTLPIIEMDKIFSTEKYQYLCEKFAYPGQGDKNTSTIYVQSGSILGNPFLIKKSFKTSMGTKTYTGSLVITYQETYTDSEGHWHTRTVTQTLYASVSKPCPYYGATTSLIYGNEAARDLIFSRKPSGCSNMNEKALERHVKRTYEKRKKAATKNMKYTPMVNEEFEVLFGGEDRNNDTQFRLLFTPLAQQNEVTLIKDPNPFGDDFSFFKERMLNYIISNHSQNFDYSATPDHFKSYSYELLKGDFISYNVQYFTNLFFDFAPLMSIPLYHQLPTDEYIFQNKFRSNICPDETESVANLFNVTFFEHPETETPTILKTNILAQDGKADRVAVTAYSYKTIRRVDYVSTIGGDGHSHLVPVYWDEYIPLSNVSTMEIQESSISRNQYLDMIDNGDYDNFIEKYARSNAIINKRGFFSFLPKDNLSYRSEELEQLYKNRNK